MGEVVVMGRVSTVTGVAEAKDQAIKERAEGAAVDAMAVVESEAVHAAAHLVEAEAAAAAAVHQLAAPEGGQAAEAPAAKAKVEVVRAGSGAAAAVAEMATAVAARG